MAKEKKNLYDLYNNSQESNSMMAALANKMIAARSKGIQTILSDFEGSEHKLEYVKTIEGVDFINDSRSTNPNAVWFALESMTKPTHWIMNMDNQEEINDDLLKLIDTKVKNIIIQGVYNSTILNFFTGLKKNVFFSMNLEEAVRTAFYAAERGETILFSPGTKSSGLYPTYRERGNKFKNAVAQL